LIDFNLKKRRKLAVDKKEKLEILKKLDEDRLRKEVLIPLFVKMGFRDVIEYHGSAEKGKDIIFSEKDAFGEKFYTGVVVKKGDITGSASSGGAMVVLNQIEQTFDEAYTDKYSLKEPVIDRCIVVTSGCIKVTAIESIRGRLKKTNLDKLVKFFDGSKLVDLLDEYMPEYFFKEFKGFTADFNSMKKDFDTLNNAEKGIALENLCSLIFRTIPGWQQIESQVRSDIEEFDITILNQSGDKFWEKFGTLIIVRCKNWSTAKKPGRDEFDAFYGKISRRGRL
jgi:hypothetical protein